MCIRDRPCSDHTHGLEKTEVLRSTLLSQGHSFYEKKQVCSSNPQQRHLKIHMNTTNKTLSSIEERIEAQQKKLAQLKAQKVRLETIEKVRNTKVARAEDTRRKILLGACIAEQMKADAEINSSVLAKLDIWLVRPADRGLFGLAEKQPARI